MVAGFFRTRDVPKRLRDGVRKSEPFRLFEYRIFRLCCIFGAFSSPFMQNLCLRRRLCDVHRRHCGLEIPYFGLENGFLYSSKRADVRIKRR